MCAEGTEPGGPVDRTQWPSNTCRREPASEARKLQTLSIDNSSLTPNPIKNKKRRMKCQQKLTFDGSECGPSSGEAKLTAGQHFFFTVDCNSNELTVFQLFSPSSSSSSKSVCGLCCCHTDFSVVSIMQRDSELCENPKFDTAQSSQFCTMFCM